MATTLNSLDIGAIMQASVNAMVNPSDEQKRANREHARRAIAAAAPTHLENWPEALTALSIPQARIDLGADGRDALLALFDVAWGGGRQERMSDSVLEARRADLFERMTQAMAVFPEGVYPRLGSRSPKDSWFGFEQGFRCTTAEHVLELFLGSTDRILEDLQQAERADFAPTLFLRRWTVIPEWAEFRCVVEAGSVLTVSQGNYRDSTPHPEITSRPAAVDRAVRDFVEGRVLPVCPLDRVVVDVVFENGDLARPLMLEINPSWGTDPCLFREADPKADGVRFRYHGDGHDYPFTRPAPVDPATMQLAATPAPEEDAESPPAPGF